MKYLFLLLPFTLSAQVEPKPKDFNYTFFSEGYTSINVSYKLDSLTQKFAPHKDSTTNKSQFIVSKEKTGYPFRASTPPGQILTAKSLPLQGLRRTGFWFTRGRKITPYLLLVLRWGIWLSLSETAQAHRRKTERIALRRIIILETHQQIFYDEKS